LTETDKQEVSVINAPHIIQWTSIHIDIRFLLLFPPPL
jgi:hypothetical protein